MSESCEDKGAGKKKVLELGEYPVPSVPSALRASGTSELSSSARTEKKCSLAR
jgi:hypothetical protein